MKIGIVEYINAYPFALALEKFNPTLAPPTTINQLFRDNQLDIFFGSSIESINTPYLPDFCVAAKGAIKSVNLYTKVPPTKIQSVRLDPCSATSNALAKILLRDHWKVDPKIVTNGGDAYIQIGDAALLSSPSPEYKVIDLASAWYEMTALPFVFALLMHRPGLDNREITHQIKTTLEWKERHCDLFLEKAAKKFNLSSNFLAAYFNLCCYHLGPEEKKGLELFVHSICP